MPTFRRLLIERPGASSFVWKSVFCPPGFFTGSRPFLSLFTPETHLNLVGESMNAYCVILCRLPFVNPMHYPHMKRFYLSASTADRAMLTAADENRQWRVIGIEPSNLFARLPEGDHSRPTPDG